MAGRIADSVAETNKGPNHKPPVWPVLFFGALSLIVANLLMFAPMREVVLRFVPDDAFYYFGIARQWSHYGFSTFDGINPTNGYHPLWQWLLVVSARAFSDADAFARAGALAGIFFVDAATVLVVRRLAREDNPARSLAYLWVAATLLLATIYGLEAPLAAFVLALAVLATPRDRREWTPARALACGAATALLFLARIDALIWILTLDAIVLAAVWPGNRRPMLRTIALMIVTQLVVITGYFLGNWLVWDHALPISAAVKAARTPLFAMAVPPVCCSSWLSASASSASLRWQSSAWLSGEGARMTCGRWRPRRGSGCRTQVTWFSSRPRAVTRPSTGILF